MKTLARKLLAMYLKSSLRGRSRFFDLLSGPLTPSGGIENVRIGDYVLPLDHRIRATRMMAYGIYERGDLDQLAKMVPEGATVIDLGANVGYCTARFAEMVGRSGRVFSFEPSPACLENLRKLEASNPSGAITIIPKGAAESTRTTTYFETERTISHGFGRLDDRPSDRHTITREESVEVTSIDDFCETQNIEQIDFVKIDVEGAEVPVLRGMQKTFAAGMRPLLLLEMTGGSKNEHENQTIAQILEPLGYQSFRLINGLQPIRLSELGESFHANVLWKSEPAASGFKGANNSE